MKRILAAMISLLLLSSCGFLPFSGSEESLLVAPKVNKQQVAVRRALESILNLSDITFKYPKTGNYRSPFVFFDLNNDGIQEAIVFYAYTDEPTHIRFTVLEESADGSWSAIHDFHGTGADDQIESIQFAKLLDKDSQCMIIGWKSGHREQGTLGIYSYGAKGFQMELSVPYILWDIGNYYNNADGLDEIVTVSVEGPAQKHQLSLLSKDYSGGMWKADYVPLADSVVEVLQIIHGRLWDGSVAVYLDEYTTDSPVATEVFQIKPNSLEPMVVGTAHVEIAGQTSIISQSSEMEYERTFRENQGVNVLCSDLDKDGVVEVPQLRHLPGTSEGLEKPPPFLTQFMHLTETGFQVVNNGVFNDEDGYLIFLPQRWIDHVTVVSQPEIREWRFYKYDAKHGVTEEELLRIRVQAAQDYQDKNLEYTDLAQSGNLKYYAYIPPLEGEEEFLSITWKELKEMFVLYRGS